MPPITRRHFVIASAAALLGACTSDDRDVPMGPDAGEPPLSVARFRNGVASGDPLADGVVLWTRAVPVSATDTMARVRYELAADPAFVELVGSGLVQTDAMRDWTIKIDLSGLQPDRAYYYRFRSASEMSPTGRTRTAPLGATPRLRLAFVTCSNYVAGYFHAYRRIAERRDLHAVVHLGDYIYENGADGPVRAHQPPRELLTLADYRERYAQYRADEDLQELHRQHPMIWVWDDHEIANNAWRAGAEAHDPAQEGDYATRRAAAMQAAFEWMPIRLPDTGDPARIWRGFTFGDLADLAMIDTRHYGRDQAAEPNGLFADALPVFTQSGDFADPARQLLGVPQQQWLVDRIGSGRARWQLIGNQVYFSPLKLLGSPRALGGGGLYLSNDKWDGYDPARSVLLQAMAARDNVVVLTGDAHEAYAFEITDDPNGPGYQPLTGDGAVGVEFVATSISSRGDPGQGSGITAIVERTQAQAEQLLRVSNPHLKYYQNTLNGYLLIDLSEARLQAEFWMVPQVGVRTDQQFLDRSYAVDAGRHRLQPISTASEPIADAPLPAP